MSNMMMSVGGYDTNKAKLIRKTNLDQNDMHSDAACEWVKSKPIMRVLMNPPYENKYGCMTIVENVLDSVKADADCAFILPDKKLEKV